MVLGCKGNLPASSAAASGCAMVPPPPPPGPAPRRDSSASLASTRANSPCGSSSAASSSEDAAGRCATTGSASPSKRGMCSTASSGEELGDVALRRGIRSAILSDLGIGQVAPIPQSPVGTPLSYPPPSMPAIMSLPPPPPPPPLPRTSLNPAGVGTAVGSHCVPPCPVGPPTSACSINSTPVTSFQPASFSAGDASRRDPGTASCTPPAACSRVPRGDLFTSSLSRTTPGTGDASQQRPLTLTATAAPSASVLLSPQSKSGDASQRTPLQVSLAMLPAAEATVVAHTPCVAETPGTPLGAASQLGSPQGDASQRSPTNGVAMDSASTFLNTGALRCWLAGTSILADTSAAELADKLAAAAPDTYED
mmetsp:Transcript_144160/g.359414  ORF Transcript_144160/g.359414 Transcript_144160/m.359414 type:complete len:367 (-) Transcript_144160:423-1523(-)